MNETLEKVADLVTAKTLFCTKEVLTSDEAAMYMGVSKSYLYKLTMKQQIPHYKPTGKMCYFNRLELEQWLQRNRCTQEAQWICAAEELPQDNVPVVWIRDAPLRLPFIGEVVKFLHSDSICIVCGNIREPIRIRVEEKSNLYWTPLPKFLPGKQQ